MSPRRSRTASEPRGPQIGAHRARHLALAHGEVDHEGRSVAVTVNEGESPLIWLARRCGRDGAPLIDAVQFAAGERLRADFTKAQLMPRTTANWTAAVASGRRGERGGAEPTEAVIAARQRLRHALAAAGPEFAGLLLDICCFLKRLDQVEAERRWPARSAKLVLQLGLDRLARHYGLRRALRGTTGQPVRTWLADDAAFVVNACGETDSVSDDPL